MKERPILFSAPMVRAFLDGRKTRRKLYAPHGVSPTDPGHLAARLANGIDKIDEQTGCWLWGRAMNNFGYGTLTINGRQAYAHRLAFELSGRDMPEGLYLLHSCDTPACINPDHLRAGTQSDNMRDCSQRGRSKLPRTVRRFGEANGASKLTLHDVATIREELGLGVTQRSLAERFGVSQSQISNIALGRAWGAT